MFRNNEIVKKGNYAIIFNYPQCSSLEDVAENLNILEKKGYEVISSNSINIILKKVDKQTERTSKTENFKNRTKFWQNPLKFSEP